MILNFGKLGGNLVKPTGEVKSAVLMIGGGGTIDCTAMDPWQQDLAAVGIASLCFDFAGIQHSSPLERPDSLGSRLDQCFDAYDHLVEQVGQVTIHAVGRSMGGPIALRFSGGRPYHNLMLVNPAAYSERAWDVDFGPDFTAVLRSGDWKDSPDFRMAERGNGEKLMVVFGDQDDLIPAPIRERYTEIGKHRDGVLLFKGVGHNKFLWPKDEVAAVAQKQLFEKSREFFA
jgi:pimeloyl-ACP methyl ester carboxylesterase